MGNGGLAFHLVASHSLTLVYLTEVAGDADTNDPANVSSTYRAREGFSLRIIAVAAEPTSSC
jgi:hypothetical protein